MNRLAVYLQIFAVDFNNVAKLESKYFNGNVEVYKELCTNTPDMT